MEKRVIGEGEEEEDEEARWTMEKKIKSWPFDFWLKDRMKGMWRIQIEAIQRESYYVLVYFTRYLDLEKNNTLANVSLWLLTCSFYNFLLPVSLKWF